MRISAILIASAMLVSGTPVFAQSAAFKTDQPPACIKLEQCDSLAALNIRFTATQIEIEIQRAYADWPKQTSRKEFDARRAILTRFCSLRKDISAMIEYRWSRDTTLICTLASSN